MYPKAYLDYLIYFHVQRDYFECHEILEEYWKEQPRHARKRHWVGLIQIAVGLYHHRRGNIQGAKRMYQKASMIIETYSIEITTLGLNVPVLIQQLMTLQQINQFYDDISLPMNDELVQECKSRCTQLGIEWDDTVKKVPDEIIHKHIKRDRTEVIQERFKQILIRKQQKEEESD